MELQILNQDGKSSGKAELGEQFATAKVNKHLLHEVVTAYLANQRKGTHSTLTRSFVSGGGKKPWKQKHTGRARAGSSRSPLWRGGGIIFGPHPRSYRKDLPHKKIKNALIQSLSAKAQSGNLVIAKKIELKEAKTKSIQSWLNKLDLPKKSLLVLEKNDDKIQLASRNISDFEVMECKHLHPYHVLNAKKIVFTPEAIQCL